LECEDNKKIGYHFHLPSNDDLKVKSYKDAMNEFSYDKIDHLVVVVGPGSFTGIRVGI
jgi:tRNA A37 threonylcarbamoyladenosine modification protein TsaB